MTKRTSKNLQAAVPPISVRTKVEQSLIRRRRQEKVFYGLGFAAVIASLLLVAILFINIFSKGLPAFWQSTITLDIYFDPELIQISEKPVQLASESDNDFRQRMIDWQTEVGFINFNRLITDSLGKVIPNGSQYPRELAKIVTPGERFGLRDMVLDNPAVIGKTFTLNLLTEANIDVWLKGNIDRSLPDHQQQLSPQIRQWADLLAADGVIKNRLSFALFMNPDSRSSLASAGLAGAFMGSLYMMLVVIVLAVPMGVAAAIYLEEFAPRNKFTDLVEVNINNSPPCPLLCLVCSAPRFLLAGLSCRCRHLLWVVWYCR